MRNATVSYNGTTFEETVNYTCEVGFRFPNGAKLLVKSCSDSGNWTGPNETCEGYGIVINIVFKYVFILRWMYFTEVLCGVNSV